MIHQPHPATARDLFVHEALRDQLVALAPPNARLMALGWRPWASASFSGARHWFEFDGGMSSVSAWEALNIPEHSWKLSNAFVADARVVKDEPAAGRWRIELLVVDE